MLKQYHATPSASTETDLIPTVGEDLAVAISDIEITAVTACTAEIFVYDPSDTLAHTITVAVAAGDTVHVEMKRYITEGA